MQIEERCFEAVCPVQLNTIQSESVLWKVREAQAERDNSWLFLCGIWLEFYAQVEYKGELYFLKQSYICVMLPAKQSWY